MMTNDERDKMIMETHDAVVRIMPMVEDHHLDLYGNGSDGSPGIKQSFAVLKNQHNNCRACSMDGKRYGIAMIMMIIAIVGIIVTASIGIANYLKP